ncbi:MAG: DUF499 domain-containing protein [Candidatus Poribacteria bacterium]|nr:DUF499 domain-containing protein [Candidatus Poribacteria bacterium]
MNINAWHEHCVLRDDVRQGTLELSEFAADLYAVRTGDALNVYRVPDLFFDRTYATDNLKKLARGVLQRLSGQGGNPVVDVQVAYGGGKTHALIALLHLAEQGNELLTHQTVQEFMEFSDLDTLPRARVALLPFDKFDVKRGLSVISPDGKKKQVKTPWGALAYQLAGDEGLAKVAEHDADYITPAQPILSELLKTPQSEGLSTLILLDEALMYMRGAVDEDPNRLGIFRDFFQGLTQAVASVDQTAIVASLISFDTVSHDPLDTQILNAIGNIFKRFQQSVTPISREDISELFRRRLFENVPSREVRQAIVDNIAEARQKLPLRDIDKDDEIKEKLVKSYPFHPDFIEVFYQKWTQLSQFQRTRGVLRTFAVALREADGKDPAEFVGPTALLGTDDQLSEAIQELVETCDEGNQWIPILTGELEKARIIQKNLPLLKSREVEAAVISTFLHSQPSGHKAELTDLYLLLAHTDIDLMSVEKGLSEWQDVSWFLKENDSSYAFGTTPNLTNMHVRAIARLTEEQINENLVKRIRDVYLGRNADNVTVHTLPQAPSDIPDNPELHFVIVGPEWTAVAGEKVSEHLVEFFNRTYRNNVIIIAPENSLLVGLRQRIRRILGWQNIENGDDMNLLNGTQKVQLIKRKQEDETGIFESVTSAYSVLIAVDEEGEIKTHALSSGTEPLFERIKEYLVKEDRLLTTSLNPDLLTPESYFELWGEDETAKPVQGLYQMFASLPRLPRMLNRQVFIDTLRCGVIEGKIVLRTVRGDGSHQTFWREVPTDENFKEKSLEIVPLKHAELHNLSAELLLSDKLPEVWQGDSGTPTVGTIREIFDGNIAPKLASDKLLFETVQSAVQSGLLMARLEGKAYLKESIPDAEITVDLELLAPLEPISGSELGANALPNAWHNEITSVGKLMHALAAYKGTPIPWLLFRDAVSDGVFKKLFEFTEGSPDWPCSVNEVDKVGLKVSQAPVKIVPEDLIGNDVKSAWDSGQPTLRLIKEVLEEKRDISISDDAFRYAVEEAIKNGIITLDDPLTNGFYNVRVRQPEWLGHAESHLTEMEIQDLPETVSGLGEIAPELEFKYRITITAEGDQPSDEVLKEINEALQKVTDKLKFD